MTYSNDDVVTFKGQFTSTESESKNFLWVFVVTSLIFFAFALTFLWCEWAIRVNPRQGTILRPLSAMRQYPVEISSARSTLTSLLCWRFSLSWVFSRDGARGALCCWSLPLLLLDFRSSWFWDSSTSFLQSVITETYASQKTGYMMKQEVQTRRPQARMFTLLSQRWKMSYYQFFLLENT